MSQGSVVCPACGGGAPKAGAACPYCGAAIPADLPLGVRGGAEWRTFCARCGQMYAAGAERCPRCPSADTDEKGGKCPRGGSDLAAETIGTSRPSRRCPRRGSAG